MVQTLINTATSPASSTKRKYNEVSPEEESSNLEADSDSIEQTKSVIFETFTVLLQDCVAAQSIPSLSDQVTLPLRSSRVPMLTFNTPQAQYSSKLSALSHPNPSPSFTRLNSFSSESKRKSDNSEDRSRETSISSPRDGRR
jgi:hypothetical protein